MSDSTVGSCVERFTVERFTVDGAGHAIDVDFVAGPSSGPRPVILMPGAIDDAALPDWSVGLVARGFALAAFRPLRDPDPDRARRAEWLVFDQRFAHGYAMLGE